MKNKLGIWVLSICMISPCWLHSQSNIYLKLGDIKGESAHKDHKDWINVGSFTHGLSNSGAMRAGGGGAGAGKVKFDEFTFTRKMDKATPVLMAKAASGAHFADAILEMTGNDGKVFYTIKLTDVIISSVNTSAECNPTCSTTEEIKLNFGSISWEYRDQNGVPVRGGWDIKMNKGI
jgi:type VI secretion system secreted protein Hcp